MAIWGALERGPFGKERLGSIVSKALACPREKDACGVPISSNDFDSSVTVGLKMPSAGKAAKRLRGRVIESEPSPVVSAFLVADHLCFPVEPTSGQRILVALTIPAKSFELTGAGQLRLLSSSRTLMH